MYGAEGEVKHLFEWIVEPFQALAVRDKALVKRGWDTHNNIFYSPQIAFVFCRFSGSGHVTVSSNWFVQL